MLKKLFISTALVGSALATGATASAGDIASTTPTPPSPPPMVPIGDYATPERPGTAEFVVDCHSSTACDSLSTWCGKNGSVFIRWTDRGGESHGVCIG